MDGWKPLATLAREVGVPEPSARRYAHAFAALVRSRRIGKATLYAPEVGELLRIAAEGFAAGRRRDEVAGELAGRFGRVHDVAPRGDDAATTPAGASVPAGDLAALLALGDRFVSVLERAVVALEAIAAKRPQEAPQDGKRPGHRPQAETGQDEPHTAPPVPRSRSEIIREVQRLRGEGLGAGAIATAMRRSGFPTLSGRGRWGKGTVKRVINGEVK